MRPTRRDWNRMSHILLTEFFVLFLSFWNSSKDMIWKKRQSGISQDLSSLIMKVKDCGVLTLRRSCISYSSDSCPNNRHWHLVNTEKSPPVFDKRKQIERASYFFLYNERAKRHLQLSLAWLDSDWVQLIQQHYLSVSRSVHLRLRA